MGRFRQLFSIPGGQPAVHGLVLLIRGGGDGGLAGQRKEGGGLLVQQPMEGEAQGTEVRPFPVAFGVPDFRRHILIGTRDGPAHRMLGGLGDAEISQLIDLVPGIKEDVFRLDVPVQDPPAFTKDQGLADIRADPEHLFLQLPLPAARGGDGGKLGERRQQLHADKHFPAHPVFMGQR